MSQEHLAPFDDEQWNALARGMEHWKSTIDPAQLPTIFPAYDTNRQLVDAVNAIGRSVDPIQFIIGHHPTANKIEPVESYLPYYPKVAADGTIVLDEVSVAMQTLQYAQPGRVWKAPHN